MPTDKERLQQARDLIMQKQFDQARLILLEIPHHPTAQKWLAKLEEIAPTGTGTAPQPLQPPRVATGTPIQPLTGSAPPIAGPAMNQPQGALPAYPGTTTTGTVNIALNINTIRYAVAGITALMAVLMIACFFFASWMDMGNMFGMDLGALAEGNEKAQLKITAMELWMGRNNGENFTMDMAKPEGGGFADVRLLDRLLILMPVGAIVLAWFAWVYASGHMNALMTIGIMTVFAFLLLAAPFFWESLSDQQVEDDFKASLDMEGGDEMGLDLFGAMFGDIFNIFENTYSTNEQKWLGGLALLTCLAGFGAEIMHETNRAHSG